MNRDRKFVPLSKHVLDLKSLHKTQRALNSLLNGQVIVGKRSQIHYSDGNVIYEVSGGGATLQDFQLVSDGGDWYNCNKFDGLTAGSEVIKVAKHQDIRCILPTNVPAGGAWATKDIRGVTYTYTYNAVAGVTTDGVDVVEYARDVVGDDASSETDFITPCLNVGDIISAFSTSFKGPDTLLNVIWQAVADGRAWAAPDMD